MTGFSAKYKRGMGDATFIIAIMVLLVLVWLGKGTGSDSPNRRSNSVVSSGSRSYSSEVSSAGQSPWYGKVTISRGNASRAYQTYEEYITLRARLGRDEAPVSISGWTLENGAGGRRYQVGNSVAYGQVSRAVIPRAANIYYEGPQNFFVPVELRNGEEAVVLTGSMPLVTKYPITSFRVNKCSGYIDGLKDVNFQPPLSNQCPDPDSYPEVRNLEKSCYDFVRGMPRCHTPEFKDVRLSNGGYDIGAVDGKVGLTDTCKAFIRTHFNYNSCVANHIADPDFYGDEWRIFLGRPWEMWAKERETITLYDSLGRVVNQVRY